MNRRQALKSIGIAASLPFSVTELLAARSRLQAEGGIHVFETLDAQESEIVAAAAERILPETDTPGARAARVEEFIDLVLTHWFTEEERRRFLRGVRDLEDRARVDCGKGFVECGEPHQVRILQQMEDEAERELEREKPGRRARRGASESPRAPFFTALKWITLYGYFTSEVGMEGEIEFVNFPGTYEGCAPRDPAAR
ncbi:MAG: gluconate 2-dehydrogenase subunit 3 family protein [Vicinamibacteria bacterium]